jgi:hypothetical protein
MERNYSNERPPLYSRDAGREHTRTINFGIEEHQDDENRFSFYSVKVKVGDWDYSGIVNAIVSAEYPAEMMQAIMNNYHQETDLAKLIDLLRTTQNFNKLRSAMNDWLSSRDQDIVKEYETMQEWRKMAKDTAREILKL